MERPTEPRGDMTDGPTGGIDFDLDDATQILARTPPTLLAWLTGLPEPWLRTPEVDGAWSPHEVVGHGDRRVGGLMMPWTTAPPRSLRRPGRVLALTAALSAAWGGFTGLSAQEPSTGPSLRVGEDRSVSSDEPSLTHVEPHLTVSPTEPDHLVATSIVFRDGVMTSDVLVSRDGGASWARTRFPACAGDPWVAWGSGEAVYFSCLAAGGAPVRAVVHRSDDGGRSWSEPVEVPEGGGGSFDHTSLAVQPRPDSHDVVYVAGMQGIGDDDAPPLAAPFVAVSHDGAAHFDPPHRIVMSNVMANAFNPVVLGPDRVGLAFVDFSVDGQSPIEHRRIWWVRSMDRGRAFSLPHLVADGTRMTTMPVAAAPTGRDQAGAVFLAYDNGIDGRQGVFFVRSDDRGATWTAPEPLATGDPDVFRAENPVTAVDSAGNVGVAWYERPPGGEDRCWRIRFALSMDAGETFLDPVTLSSEEFCARPETVDRARRWWAGGDYFGLAATGEGVFRALWADSRSGVWQVRTTEVEVQTHVEG